MRNRESKLAHGLRPVAFLILGILSGCGGAWQPDRPDASATAGRRRERRVCPCDGRFQNFAVNRGESIFVGLWLKLPSPGA